MSVWNDAFRSKGLLWGDQPSETVAILECSLPPGAKTVLVIGAGYGRNAKYFADKGYSVDALEFSHEAVQIGKAYAPTVNFIEMSILDFRSRELYDAIYCHSFIHLFLEADREVIVGKIADHAHGNSVVMLSACTKSHPAYGLGKQIEYETFEGKSGVTLHFYDENEFRHIDSRLGAIRTGILSEEYEFYYGLFRKRADLV